MPTLDQLSDVLMEIHELPERVPFDQFQDAALSTVKQVLNFDSAWWGLVAGLDIHSAARFGLPEGYRRQWESIREHDPIASAALATPLKTVVFNQADLAPHTEINTFLKAYDIQHVLCTATRQPGLGLYAFLSLYRQDVPFTEDERLVKQCLMRHLMYALGQSWRGSLEKNLQKLNGQPDIRAAAVCDQQGLVLFSEATFAETMRNEWSAWKGPRLPNQLEHALGTGDRYVGGHVQVKIDAVSDMYVLRLSERDPFNDLTKREADAARLFAAGQTYKEAARELGISPTTVRHYLRNVYSKLHISDKAALATVLARHNTTPKDEPGSNSFD